MPMEVLVLATVVIIGAALLALAFFRRPARDEGTQAVEEAMRSLQSSQAELAGRLAAMAEAQAAAQGELTKALNDRLDAVSKNMGETLQQSANKQAETMSNLQARLAVIDTAQKNITELSGQVVTLQDILANKQARGAFGEIQLADIVRNALPPSAYELQATLSNGKRADCLIRLPNPPGPIVIDSKFPLEAYRALRVAEDDAGRQAAARNFAAAVQKHVSDIAGRYIVPGDTAESALMFLPSEAVYAELHASFPQVVERSFRAKVWIVSPTTLMATLHTVRAVLKDVRMREQAGVIQKEVMTLLTDVERLSKRTGDLRRHFGLAEKDIREIETSAGKISSRGERIGEVQLGEADAQAAIDDTGNVARGGPRLVRDGGAE